MNLVTKVLTGNNGGFTGFNNRLIIDVASITPQPSGPGLISVTIQSAGTQNGVCDGLVIGHQDPTLQPYNFDGGQVRETFDNGNNSKAIVGAQTITTDQVPFNFVQGKALVVSTHWSGATDTGRFVAGPAGCNNFFSGADQVMATAPTGAWSNDGSWTWTASVDFIPNPVPPPVIIQSDHASAELQPGYSSPGAQPPLAALASLFKVSLPLLNTPLARKNLAFLQPPLQSGTPPAMTQAVLAVPAGLTGRAQNLLPYVPMRVLGVISLDRDDPGSWVIPVAIAGLKTITVRVAYKDLRIEPGMRGLMLQYPSGGPVTVTCNATGMSLTVLGGGPISSWVPLYMLEDGIDLTIAATGTFGAGSTALLVDEFQTWP